MASNNTVKMQLKDTGGQALISCNLKFKRTKGGKPIPVDVPEAYVNYLLDKYGSKLIVVRSGGAAVSDDGKVPPPYIAATMEPSRRDRQIEAALAAGEADGEGDELVATPKKKPAAKKPAAKPKKKPAAKKPAKKAAVEPVTDGMDGSDGESFVGGAPA